MSLEDILCRPYPKGSLERSFHKGGAHLDPWPHLSLWENDPGKWAKHRAAPGPRDHWGKGLGAWQLQSGGKGVGANVWLVWGFTLSGELILHQVQVAGWSPLVEGSGGRGEGHSSAPKQVCVCTSM